MNRGDWMHSEEIERFVLTNRQQTRVVILSLGGIIQEFSIVQDGKRENLVVSCDSTHEYMENPYQIGKQIGRVAGRIKGAEFLLADEVVQVPANEGYNTLHGGNKGLGTQVFSGEQVSNNQVVLKKALTSAVDGFPGELAVTITYTLNDDNRLEVIYEVEAKTATVFDPTIHIYWALPQGLTNTTLQIQSADILEVDAEKIPTGQKIAVKDTAYDFNGDKDLAQAVNQLRQEESLKGFDTAFEVKGDFNQPVAQITESDKRVKIKTFSDRNGLVIFTADPKTAANDEKGLFNALATEVQTLPDALHHDSFGDIRLQAGECRQIKLAYQVEKY